MPMENRLAVIGKEMTPQNTRIACAVPIKTQNTMPPPTTSASRRSPRRQTVRAASTTKIKRSSRLN